jgi:GcrA cell cycle regulator
MLNIHGIIEVGAPAGVFLPRIDWTDERVGRLREMHKNGASASDIAVTLGGVTRSAVLGKIHRLGLSVPIAAKIGAKITAQLRGQSAVQVAAQLRERKRQLANKPSPGKAISFGRRRDRFKERAAAVVAEPTVAPLLVPLLSTRTGQCKWICEDDGALCCAHPVEPGRSWCPHHCSVAFMPRVK